VTPPAPEPDPTAQVEDEDDSDGDGESMLEGPSAFAPRTAPKIELSEAEIADKARHDPAALGSLSLGQPARGALVNGVQMPRDAQWKLMDPGNAWGTQETVDYIALAIHHVNTKFPETAALPIGDISAHNGGHLTPHKSHQAGRDVDLNYYLRGDQRWYSRTNAQNIDLPRSWALVKVLLRETEIDMIFIDSSIQRLLADHAVASGEDPAWIDSLFQVRGKNGAAKIRHVRGHATHLHVRFFNPRAQELGRRAEHYLPASMRPVAQSKPGKNGALAHGHGKKGQEKAQEPAGNVNASTRYVMHRARNGDVLVNLARHYGTTPEAIQQANGMKNNALQMGHSYKIPVAAPAPAPGRNARHGQILASDRAPNSLPEPGGGPAPPAKIASSVTRAVMPAVAAPRCRSARCERQAPKAGRIGPRTRTSGGPAEKTETDRSNVPDETPRSTAQSCTRPAAPSSRSCGAGVSRGVQGCPACVMIEASRPSRPGPHWLHSACSAISAARPAGQVASTSRAAGGSPPTARDAVTTSESRCIGTSAPTSVGDRSSTVRWPKARSCWPISIPIRAAQTRAAASVLASGVRAATTVKTPSARPVSPVW
jgi:penicillin-insensitive murein endopeptidase